MYRYAQCALNYTTVPAQVHRTMLRSLRANKLSLAHKFKSTHIAQ